MSHLNVPSFSDFLDDMSDERKAYWQNDALHLVQEHIGISFDITNPDDTKRFVTAMFHLNQRWTLLMLQDYHEWLIEKLDASSLHLI